MARQPDRAALDRFLPPSAQAAVVAAIGEAERGTSGQIKVHIEPTCPLADPYARAVAVFTYLGLDKTRLRNAVLIYIASDDRRFALVGDTGIHAEVGDPFWSEASATLSSHFKASRFEAGLVSAVEAIGARLAKAFPPSGPGDNELSDEITTEGPPSKT